MTFRSGFQDPPLKVVSGLFCKKSELLEATFIRRKYVLEEASLTFKIRL